MRRCLILAGVAGFLLAIVMVLVLIVALRSIEPAGSPGTPSPAPTATPEPEVMRLSWHGCVVCADAPAAPSPSPAPIMARTLAYSERVSLGTFTITAYCACPACCGKSADDPAYGLTATGTSATEGRTVAVDPDVLPYGTALWIDGREYIAEDCGAFEGRHIDIYMADHDAALRWGLRECEVFVGN